MSNEEKLILSMFFNIVLLIVMLLGLDQYEKVKTSTEVSYRVYKAIEKIYEDNIILINKRQAHKCCCTYIMNKILKENY